MKLAVQLLTFNDSEFLPHCLESLAGQTDRDWELWTRDQSTVAEHILKVSKVMEAFKGSAILHVSKGENLGFAGGHQNLFEKHDADLILLVNVDTILAYDFIEKVKAKFDSEDRLGSATGIVYRWSLDGDNQILTNEVDSMGLKRLATEQIIDLREYEKSTTFGVSGCLPMYRRSAVTESDVNGRLFDPEYHSYKEDIDLAYRLKAGGWKHEIVQDAVAYHHRTFKPGSRPKASSWAQRQSYRNHIWNLIMHLTWSDWIIRGLIIIPFELAKTVYLLVQSPKDVYRAWRETASKMPDLISRRSYLKNKYAK
jgi:GT2 family glycosyltransferase